jgi:hypothetical protein
VLNVRCSRHMCSGNGWPIRCTPAVDAPPPIAHANGKGQMTALPVGQDATGTRQLAAWRERVMPPVEELAGDLWSIPVPIPDNPLRYVLCYAFGAAGGLEAPLLSRCVNAATLLLYYVPEVVHYRNRIHLPGWDTIVAMMISAALRFSDLDMFGHVNHARHGVSSGWTVGSSSPGLRRTSPYPSGGSSAPWTWSACSVSVRRRSACATRFGRGMRSQRRSPKYWSRSSRASRRR